MDCLKSKFYHEGPNAAEPQPNKKQKFHHEEREGHEGFRSVRWAHRSVRGPDAAQRDPGVQSICGAAKTFNDSCTQITKSKNFIISESFVTFVCFVAMHLFSK